MVDGATLERLCGRKSTGGSNPPPSASHFYLNSAESTAVPAGKVIRTSLKFMGNRSPPLRS